MPSGLNRVKLKRDAFVHLQNMQGKKFDDQVGKPIVFVGVGQTYTDIRNLNVDHCVKALVKG